MLAGTARTARAARATTPLPPWMWAVRRVVRSGISGPFGRLGAGKLRQARGPGLHGRGRGGGRRGVPGGIAHRLGGRRDAPRHGALLLEVEHVAAAPLLVLD